MNKTDLIKQVSKNTEIEEGVVRIVLNGIVDSIHNNLLYGVDVKIKGFMNFTLGVLKKRTIKNPRTGEFQKIPKKYKIRTTLSTPFKQKLSEKIVY